MTISKERIEALLYKADPEGLIKMGAPADEYSPEARMLRTALLSNPGPKDPTELAQRLCSIFDEMFEGCGGGGYDFGPVAQEIWAEQQQGLVVGEAVVCLSCDRGCMVGDLSCTHCGASLPGVGDLQSGLDHG
ncbi:MAG: hypothetical protein O7G84_13850 [Gammaproteobacteria bacterium]|nr:hypothetical protein [Gammaproteobacteria bacterium]